MKQKDIALIIVIIFFTAIFSYFISNTLFASPKNRQTQVEVVQPITADFPTPDTRYFNGSAIDPTQTITISENANTDPFKATQ